MPEDIPPTTSKSSNTEDDSLIAKNLRDETKPERSDQNDEKPSSLWQSVSINKSNGQLVIEVSGITKVVFEASDPTYSELLEELKKRYPELAPGKICYRYICGGGREKRVTKDFEDSDTE